VGGPPGDVETVYLGTFRREALEAVGGFDETLVRNQDYELNHRLRQAGFRVFFHPDLQVRYQPRATVRGLWRQYFDYGTWKRHVARIHPGSLRLRQVLPPLFLLALAAGGILAATTELVWPVVVLGALYLAALAEAAIVESGRAGQHDLVLLVMVALAVMHLSWGLGFLVGRRRMAL
jgi:hypothetical protein